jgi:hypothetical protein
MTRGMTRQAAHIHIRSVHAALRYLRCDPEDHFVLLTEPPLNAPEARTHAPCVAALTAVHNNIHTLTRHTFTRACATEPRVHG